MNILKKPRQASLLAQLSLFLALTTFFLIGFTSNNIYFILPSILGLLSGIISLVRLKREKKYLGSKICATIGVSLCGLMTIGTLAPVLGTIADRIKLTRRPITYEGNSKNLQKTIVVPTLDTKISKGKNVIWCSSFQLAWNELEDSVLGEPVRLKDSEQICNRLNMALQSKTDLLEGSYFSVAGLERDGIGEKIQTEMARRFPDTPKPELGPLGLETIVAYSYLEVEAKFKIPFLENNETLDFRDSSNKETPIKSFGIRRQDAFTNYKLREQVEILYCEGDWQRPEAFVIDLCKYSNPYQIVVARVELQKSLLQTIEYIQNKIIEYGNTGSIKTFKKNDVLLVPNMFWAISHRFQELEDKQILNEKLEGYHIDVALQTIKFRLDRSGATLQSTAMLKALSAPTYYIFDRPFLIYMKKRTGEYPFFVMLVGNSELLTKWEK